MLCLSSSDPSSNPATKMSRLGIKGNVKRGHGGQKLALKVEKYLRVLIVHELIWSLSINT